MKNVKELINNKMNIFVDYLAGEEYSHEDKKINKK